jgi:hypothetical protein
MDHAADARPAATVVVDLPIKVQFEPAALWRQPSHKDDVGRWVEWVHRQGQLHTMAVAGEEHQRRGGGDGCGGHAPTRYVAARIYLRLSCA